MRLIEMDEWETKLTDRESDCIRVMLNFARGGVTTWAALKSKMLADGWTAEEAKAALISIGPKIES